MYICSISLLCKYGCKQTKDNEIIDEYTRPKEIERRKKQKLESHFNRYKLYFML